MNFINGQRLKDLLRFDALIERLDDAFGANTINVPLRHHHDFNDQNTLLLMPAWQNESYGGVKIVTVCPGNKQVEIPSIQGIYYLFDAASGTPISTLDAAVLTNLRTAAASALASSYLSRETSSVLMMIGTGSLAPYLIQAHTAIRPISKVLVYGRNLSKAKSICKELSRNKYECIPVDSIEKNIHEADIISCATLSQTPLIKGEWLHKGQHVDLVGSFKPTMREADDNLIIVSSLYVDAFEGATKESGDLVIPLKNQVIDHNHIKGDLFDLCSKQIEGRKSELEITCFKSVGHALEDLVAAGLAYELWNNSQLR